MKKNYFFRKGKTIKRVFNRFLGGKKMSDDPEKNYQIKLEDRLKGIGVWHRFIQKPESTVHTADASKVTGIDLHRISKNLMAKTSDGRYAILIVPGDRIVNYKAAAQALGCKSIGLVPFNEAESISGFPPGGTPSIGHDKRLAAVIDEELTQFETFYCGGGSTKMLLELRRDDVIRLNEAKIFKISQQKR